MDDLGYEGRGRRILELERELTEARQQARRPRSLPRSECDLCQEPVDPSGSDWKWVEDGWSLACLKCLDRIRLPLEKELAEARRGILECQTRIVALTEEVAANQTLRRIHDACRESAEKEVDQLTRDRDEAHSQLAESYAAIREVPRICLCAGGAGICGFCLWHEKHAPVIERATKHA